MNAPMPNQPQTPPMPGATPPGGNYASGAEVMQGEQGANGQIENPVIAGFRSIMLLVKAMKDRNDPRAEPAAQQLAGLLTTLQGAAQEAPPGTEPQQPGAAPAGEPPMPGAAAPTQPGSPPAPEMSSMPMGAGPNGMAFNPFEAPPEEQSAASATGARPMQPQPSQPGRRPVVLM